MFDSSRVAAGRVLLEQEPAFSLGHLEFWPYIDEFRRERLKADLKTAGIPG